MVSSPPRKANTLTAPTLLQGDQALIPYKLNYIQLSISADHQ